VTANTSVESLGVFLPEREVTTSEVVKGCQRRVLIPLERLTGIKSRRMAGDTEFSVDLAHNAVARCLAASQYGAADIDLIVAANISKQDSSVTYNVEPTTAAVLRRQFGLHRALAFDLSNACAGVFTAIMVVDELIRRGDVRRALVVSGEYITHLTATAQRELHGLHDERLACLTLGDAGVCLLLEHGTGFDFIDIYTVPEHAELCMAHSAESHGAIMFTDSVTLARAGIAEVVTQYGEVATAGRVTTDPRYFIPHQTSSNSIKEASRVTNRRFGRKVCRSDNMVDNLKHRGNTATTSHWVAINDLIEASAVQPGDRIIFSVTASGITVGIAQYRVEQFASRPANGGPVPAVAPPAVVDGVQRGYYRSVPANERVQIRAAATCAPDVAGERGNVQLAAQAVRSALAAGGVQDDHPGLLVYSGVYRESFISEPALATLVAKELSIKGSHIDSAPLPFLAFDVMNGPPGVLMACQIAGRMLLSRDGVAVVAASEFNETPVDGQQPLGLASAGSALVLERSSGQSGFRSFLVDTHDEYLDWYHAYAFTDESGPPRLRVDRDERWTARLPEAVAASVAELLRRERLCLDDFAVIFPPQLGPEFSACLAGLLGVEQDRFVSCGGGNLFTAGAAAGWEAAGARANEPGSLGLFVAVGAGIEVACATYEF
jgi:3-oxoacyl-[acyl-carrier-protein] synthase III